MIKFIYIFFLIAPLFHVNAQDDATGDMIAAIWLNGLTEAQALKAVEKKQKDVHSSVKSVARKTAAMIVLKKKYLKHLKTANEMIETGFFIKELYDIGKSIVQYQDKSLKVAKNHPEIFEEATINHAKVTLNLINVMLDLELAFIQNKDNLIDDIDRLEIMEAIKTDLLALKFVSQELYAGIRALVITGDYTHTAMDFSSLVYDMEETYDKIFPEEIKE